MLERKDDKRWRLACALTAAIVFVGVAPSLESGIENWDVQVKTQVAWNLLHGRGVSLSEAPSPIYLVDGRDGRRYPMYPFLAYVLQVPTALLYMATGKTYEGLVPLLLLALTAAVLVATARRLRVSPPAAAAGALLACLATALRPMVGAGHDNGIEVLAMAVLLWAAAGEQSSRAFAWAGLCAGIAIGTRLGAVPLLVPGAALILLQRRGDWRRMSRHALAFAIGCAPGIVSVVAFNLYRFGSPFEVHPGITQVREVFVPWFSSAYWDGVLGLTVSPGKGALWYSPPLIAVVVFAVPLARRYPAAIVVLGSYAVAALVTYGRLAFWHGDWGWGPRLIAPVILASAPFAWWCWEKATSIAVAARAGLGALALVLVFAQAVPTAVAPVAFYLRIMDDRAAAEGLPRPRREFPMGENRGYFYFRVDTSPLVVLGRAYWTGLAGDRPGPVERLMAERLRRLLPWIILTPLLSLACVLVVDRHRPARAPSGPETGRRHRASR